MKYKQSPDLSFAGLLIANVVAGILGIIFLYDIPFVFKFLVCGLGAFIGAYIPKMYRIIFYGDYW